MRHAFPLLVAGLSALTFGGVWFAGGRTVPVAPTRAAPVVAPSDVPLPTSPTLPSKAAEPTAAPPPTEPPPTAPPASAPATPSDPMPSGARSDCGDNLATCYPPGYTPPLL